MLGLLGKLFALRPPQQSQIEAIAREKFGPCSLCHDELHGHHCALLGSAIVSDDRLAVSRLEEAVNSHSWQDATRIREWRGDADELEFYIIRCPADERFALVKLHSLAELWANDWVEDRVVLDERETNEISKLAGLQWWQL